MSFDLAQVWADAKYWLAYPFFTIGDTEVTLGRLVSLLVMIAVVYWVASIVERGVRQVAAKQGAREFASAYAVARVLRYTIWVLGTVFALNFLGFNLTSLAFIGGTVAVGIGFGLQNIFSNFISGIIILLEQTLKIDDYIELERGVRGHVKEIGLRYTRVQTNDAVDILVPNSEFINNRVTNWTFEKRLRRFHIPFGVAYGSDKDAVRACGVRAARRAAGVLFEEHNAPDVWLVNFGDSSLDFELVVWLGPEGVSRPSNVHAQLCWALDDELRAAGIEIPFPQRDLHVRSGTMKVKMEG